MAKFALPMKDGVAVSTMVELREHFDLKKAIRYLGNGRLMKWLRDRGYDEDADKLEDLRGNVAQIDRLEFAQRLCSVLGMIFDKTKIDPKELEGLMEFGRKADKLAQYTNDTDILGNADRAAFDQGDLDKLAKDTIPEIYLCNGELDIPREFIIPLEAQDKHYYGFGNVIARIPSSEYVDFEELGIRFDKEKYKVKFDEDYSKIDQAGTIEQQKENYFRSAQEAYNKEDYAKAIEEFRKAANMGYVKAMTKLGRLYYEKKAGEAIEASEAVKWLERAVAEHDTDAMQLLSDMYFNGQGVEKNEEQAFCYLKDAVEGAEEPSKENLYALGHMYRLGLGTAKDIERAQDYLKEAAEKGNACAMNELGIIHKNAYDIIPNPQDEEEATSWFKKAARAGNESSMLSLGRWREERKDYEEAADWYREAMKAGNSEGKFRLGCLYLDGKGVQKEEFKAFNLIKDAAENNADAMNCLGFLYDHGRGVAQDKKQAMEWYQKAADLGHTDAMYNIGMLYEFCGDITQDYAEAAKWFKKAADNGDADGMYQIGRLYLHGMGVAIDEKLAYKWFDKAADAGCSDAMNRLGEMCSDKYQIQNWYQKSANAGNALGMERLGDCFNQGGYYQKAKEWYEKAAKLGRGEAAHKIARYYEKGYGVKKNQEVANHWIKEAEKLGYTSILDSKVVKTADTVAETIVPGYGLAKKVFSFFN